MTTATPDVCDMPGGTILEEHTDLAGGHASAVFDTTETYRYLLTRIWDTHLPIACWVMLNPSTATATHTDATLTRVVDFTHRFGCGGLAIVNLFAVRSRHPDVLLTHPDPVGPLNDLFTRHAIRTTTSHGGPVIAAWGAWGNRRPLRARATHVLALLTAAPAPAQCLGTTSDTTGHQPLHPLMLAANTHLHPLKAGRP